MNQPCSPVPPGFRRDLPRWRQLITPAWLGQLLAGAPVAAAPAGRWRLLEVGNGRQAHFDHGHIAGAGYLDTDRLEQGPLWNKRADATLLKLLLELGVAHDTTVLLAGHSMVAAARAAHLLLYAGVADVRLLDGGIAAWRAAGLPLVATPVPAPAPAATALTTFGAPFPGCPAWLFDMDQARALLAGGDGILVSIRTRAEFVGATSGYSYIAARGEIPGARWGRAGDDGDVDSMSHYHDRLGRMKAAAEIASMWQAAGIVPDQRTVFYCGTGWRASLAFFYAWLMGWQHIAVFDGGWCEWSRDPSNPQLCAAVASAMISADSACAAGVNRFPSSR